MLTEITDVPDPAFPFIQIFFLDISLDLQYQAAYFHNTEKNWRSNWRLSFHSPLQAKYPHLVGEIVVRDTSSKRM